MDATRLDHTRIKFALLPALVPAACYLLLENLPIAYAAWGYAFLGTPVVAGGLLGWRHSELSVGRYFSLAAIYALACVFISELADAVIPLVGSNLINLPAYVILAALLFSVAGLITRAIRSRQLVKRSRP
jgi:hypothetical protein